MDIVLGSVKKTHRLLVVQEAPLIGGWGGEIAAQVSEKVFPHLHAAPVRLGAKRFPTPSAEQFFPEVYPQRGDIVRAILGLMH
jgi:pyruvate dehydrogenase E1 component beta subunit